MESEKLKDQLRAVFTIVKKHGNDIDVMAMI